MNFKRIVHLSVIGCLAWGAALPSGADEPAAKPAAAPWLQEWVGAYPADAQPNGQRVNIDLFAAVAEQAIVPPYRTATWAYNGSAPGPIVRIKLGDSLQARLYNQLPQATTVHWHGVRVPNAMDGVPGLTQEAVPPGGNFTYQFTPKDPGTYWYHPHQNAAEQIERGLYGVLVVEAPDDPKYSQDWVWVLDDWLMQRGGEIYPKFVTGHDLMHDGRWGNVLTVNGKQQPIFAAKPGERIRIRIVNVANGRVFAPEFAGLTPQVIAVDGLPVDQPLPLQGFLVAPGNRVDLDVTVPADMAGKSLPVSDTFTRQQLLLASLDVATGEAVATPGFPMPSAKHVPDWRAAAQTPVDQVLELDARRGGKYGITWSIGGHNSHADTPLTLQKGRFYRLRFSNRSSRLHPMHLHGQFFRVLAVDGQPREEPHWRDTVLVGPKQTVDIGLVPLDPGSWALHCHVLEHAEAGMMMTVKVQ